MISVKQKQGHLKMMMMTTTIESTQQSGFYLYKFCMFLFGWFYLCFRVLYKLLPFFSLFQYVGLTISSHHVLHAYCFLGAKCLDPLGTASFLHLRCVLLSYYCWNKLPQTEWLKTTQTYYLMVCEVTNPK